jgi:hypothetical protein
MMSVGEEIDQAKYWQCMDEYVYWNQPKSIRQVLYLKHIFIYFNDLVDGRLTPPDLRELQRAIDRVSKCHYSLPLIVSQDLVFTLQEIKDIHAAFKLLILTNPELPTLTKLR